jgi:NAD(P)-dependent dehydrogenase (short-subunit alcohol dehydrogenase family)
VSEGTANGSAGKPADVVLITGSGHGLGLETAVHLAQHGFRVVATVRDLGQRAAIEEAAAAGRVELDVVQLDLNDSASIHEAVASIVSSHGGIFGLVNNGSIGLRGCLEDTTDEEVRRVYETNVLGTITLTRAVLPHMRAAARGRIVNISSVGGRISAFGVGIYCSSKFALEGLSEALALEVQPFGIKVVVIEPGIIKTTRWSANRGTAAGAQDPSSPYYRLFQESEAAADRLVERSKTTPADVAKAVHHALTTENPKLRNIVGRPASVAVVARRYFPERMFDRLYHGTFMKRIRKAAAAPQPE